jgi:hypothetical protein
LSSKYRLSRRGRLALAALAIAVAVPMAVASSASAANYAPPFDVFNNCPVDSPELHTATNEAACVAAVANGGSITLGKITTPLGPQTTSMGVYDSPNAPEGLLATARPDHNTLVAKPARVPGGLLNLVCKGDPSNAIVSICKTLENSSLNRVSADARIAGRPTFALFPGPTVPIRIKLINPLLGNNCFIGSRANPIVLNLQLGLNPDSALNIMEEIPGFEDETIGIHINNIFFDDTTFAVPKATNCGPLDLFSGAINSRAGLPSPAGSNSIHLEGDSYLFDAMGATPADTLKAALESTEQ